MKTRQLLAIVAALIALCLPACQAPEDASESGQNTIVVSSPKAKDVIITQTYVCQIHSQRHIEVRALVDGYLLEIPVKEGQLVTKDQVLFKVNPVLYKAKWDAEEAEVQLAELELKYTQSLADKNAVSEREVPLYKAKLLNAKAKAARAEAEYNFTKIKAPFDGIIDRLQEQQGSLIKECAILTTLSDNSLMWVYFNLPEARYLEYMHSSDQEKADQRIELQLADGSKFKYRDAAGRWQTSGHFQPVKQSNLSGAIEANFNNGNGNIAFRADFPNPDRILRHGMTGTILLHRPLKNAIVIPQRATFEILDRRYVYVVDEKAVVHQREIGVEHELDDIYVINRGLSVADKFVFEGVRQVHDGRPVEYEFRPPEQILAHQEYPAE